MTHLEKSWKAIVFGSDDYVASIGAKRSKNGEELVYARQSIVAHAKAFDCQAIDMVYIDFKDIDGLKLNSKQGADMGFTGKQVIHPNNKTLTSSSSGLARGVLSPQLGSF